MMSWRILLQLLLAGAVAACAGASTEVDDDTDTPVEPTTVDLSGAWRAGGDESVFYSSRLLGNVEFIEFENTVEGGGFLQIYGSDEASGMLLCESALFIATDGGSLEVGLAALDGAAQAYLFTRDGDALTIHNVYGDRQDFTLVDDVASSAVCGTTTVEDDVTFDVRRTNFGGLAHDGTALRLPTGGGVVALDMAAGTAGDPSVYDTSYRHIFTMQGEDAWGHCGCGGSNNAGLSDPSGLSLDLVDTNALGHEISVETGVWDGTNLWLAGYSYEDAQEHLLKVNSAALANEVDADFVIHIAIKGMAAHDGSLYAMTRSSLVELSQADGSVLETWKIPNLGDASPFGLTHDGDAFFIAATTDDQQTRVIRLQLD
jgi:hypothetical protein